VSVLILSIGLVVGGIVPRVFFPDFAGEFMQVELQMNEGTPAYITHANMDHLAAELENTDRKLQAKHGLDEDIVRTVFAWSDSDTSGGMLVELAKHENGPVTITELQREWRDAVGQIPGARGLRIGNAGGGPGGGGPDISFQLVGSDLDQLEAAASALEQRVQAYEGTYDVRNSFEGGLKELQLDIRPEAE